VTRGFTIFQVDAIQQGILRQVRLVVVHLVPAPSGVVVQVVAPPQWVLWVYFERPGWLGLQVIDDGDVRGDAFPRRILGNSLIAVVIRPDPEGGRVGSVFTLLAVNKEGKHGQP
jgi:hypothetical protein